MNIGVWGDSIVYGKCDSEALGWVGRVRKARSADQDLEATYNYGLCGDTSDNLLSRFSREFDSNVYGLDLVVFAIGLNDCSQRGDAEEFLVPLEEFEENVRALINEAQNKRSKVVIVGLTNVDEVRTSPLPASSTKKTFLNKNVSLYNDTLKRIAEENKVQFINIFELLENSDLADGLHPNAGGYEKITNVFLKNYTSI